jgi:hypothetical protein
MTEPPQMPAMTFRGTGDHGAGRAVGGLVFMVAGIALFVLVFRTGAHAAGTAVGAAVAVALGAYGIVTRASFTTIDKRGIRTVSGPAKRGRFIAWSDIEDIDVQASRPDEDSTQRVQVQPSSGRSFVLPWPTATSSAPRGEPQFDRDLATIRQYWQWATAAAGPGRRDRARWRRSLASWAGWTAGTRTGSSGRTLP